MANGTLPPELFAEQQQLNRQQQMAQMLMQQGTQQPQGQMVSGQYVKPSIFAQLVPLAQMYAGTRMAQQGDKRALDMAAALRGKEQEATEKFIRASQGTPAQYFEQQAGPTQNGQPIPLQIETPATGPNYGEMFRAGTSQYAPAGLRAAAFDLLKPVTTKEGETIQQRNFGAMGGMTSLGQGGEARSPAVKQAMQQLGISKPLEQLTPQELQAVNQKIDANSRSSAGSTNLTVNTGKAYTGAFGEGIAKDDLAKYSIAEKAPTIYQNAINTEDLINKGAITGLGADYKLNLARALNVVGADNNEIIKNTEQLVANRGQIVLDSIKASGLGAGQGFTDKDRIFLEKVKGGTIVLNSKTLLELAKIEKKVAQASVDSWNNRLPNIPKEAIQGTGVGPIQLQQNQWRVK